MSDEQRTCFIAMPITTHPQEATSYGDPDHWIHLMEHLFVPAIQDAGFEVVRPVSKGSSMIHADIVRNLERCDMVLCDLSGLNPNVFFELGVRTSLDKPMTIVRDENTRIPFDLGGVNAHTYSSGLAPWNLNAEVAKLAAHLIDAVETCAGRNPLWRQFGLTMRAQESNPNEGPTEAALELLTRQVEALSDQLIQQHRPIDQKPQAETQTPAVRRPFIESVSTSRRLEHLTNALKLVSSANTGVVEVFLSEEPGWDFEITIYAPTAEDAAAFARTARGIARNQHVKLQIRDFAQDVM